MTDKTLFIPSVGNTILGFSVSMQGEYKGAWWIGGDTPHVPKREEIQAREKAALFNTDNVLNLNQCLEAHKLAVTEVDALEEHEGDALTNACTKAFRIGVAACLAPAHTLESLSEKMAHAFLTLDPDNGESDYETSIYQSIMRDMHRLITAQKKG